MKTYYKVLCKTVNFSKLTSVAGINYIDLEYMPNIWTYPKIPNSKLFVFDMLEKAKNCDFGTEIWECQVKNPSKIIFVLNAHTYFSVEQVKEFWKSRKNKKKSTIPPEFLTFAPEGTIICDSVKLLKFRAYRGRD